MKTIAAACLFCLLSASVSGAGEAVISPAAPPLLRIDWQYPHALPPRFRNHCGRDVFSGRPYCSAHCGFEYQFYYCSPASFGCCRLGYGYCDWSGLLRCHP
jgi:hypothetical protein